MINKYQEALIKLVSHNYSTRSEKNEYINTLLELVNKETPMEVDKTTIRKEDMTGEGYYFLPFACCPNCKRDVFEDDEYCPHCGQRLDWSDDDE